MLFNTVFNLKLLKIDKICVFLKTWKKFRKPGEKFQKSFGHPEISIVCTKLKNLFYHNHMYINRKISMNFYTESLSYLPEHDYKKENFVIGNWNTYFLRISHVSQSDPLRGHDQQRGGHEQ